MADLCVYIDFSCVKGGMKQKRDTWEKVDFDFLHNINCLRLVLVMKNSCNESMMSCFS